MTIRQIDLHDDNVIADKALCVDNQGCVKTVRGYTEGLVRYLNRHDKLESNRAGNLQGEVLAVVCHLYHEDEEGVQTDTNTNTVRGRVDGEEIVEESVSSCITQVYVNHDKANLILSTLRKTEEELEFHYPANYRRIKEELTYVLNEMWARNHGRVLHDCYILYKERDVIVKCRFNLNLDSNLSLTVREEYVHKRENEEDLVTVRHERCDDVHLVFSTLFGKDARDTDYRIYDGGVNPPVVLDPIPYRDNSAFGDILVSNGKVYHHGDSPFSPSNRNRIVRDKDGLMTDKLTEEDEYDGRLLITTED